MNNEHLGDCRVYSGHGCSCWEERVRLEREATQIDVIKEEERKQEAFDNGQFGVGA